MKDKKCIINSKNHDFVNEHGHNALCLHNELKIYLVRSPVQNFPPFFGAGLLQCLLVIETPAPQVLVHGDHGLHSPHLPSCGGGGRVCGTHSKF